MNGSTAQQLDGSTASQARPRSTFTPAMDAAILRVYREIKPRDWRAPAIRNLARALGLPRWRVSHRARELGAYQPRIKELPWSSRELHILELNAHYTAKTIQEKLKASGFIRSFNGIHVKLVRMRFKKQCVKGSARVVAECFGVDPSTVADQWIRQGLLKASRRGTDRTSQQGGDEWLIKEKDIKAFIINNIGIIDLRKVDKFWFVAILAGDAAHLGDFL
jgi:hypothetical protein